MEIAVNTVKQASEKNAMETLFSYLDKGIDDMEAGRLHAVDKAFQIIKDKMQDEL